MTTNKPPIMWLPVTVFIITTLVSLIGVPLYGYFYGYSWSMWLAMFLVLGANGMSITMGYHRLWAHNSFKAHWLIRLPLVLFGAAATQNSVLVWASGHRRHHRHVDDNEKDPYSAKRGFWFSHIGWMLRAYPSGTVDFSNVKDLQRDPLVVWQHKWYVPLALATNIIPAAVIGWALGDVWAGLLLVGFLRLVISHHTTFFINSLAHIWGRRPYTEENTARDNDLLALLTYGEGYHNYHHIFQGDYRNGIRWWHYDPTKWVIYALSKVGLTYDLKRTPAAKIRESLISTQLAKIDNKSKELEDMDLVARLEHEREELRKVMAHWSELRLAWFNAKKASVEQAKEELGQKAAAELAHLTEQIKQLESELKLRFKRVRTM